MDGYSGKRVVGGPGLSRNSGLSFTDVNHEEITSHLCNRIGCSTRHSSSRNFQNIDPEKLKYLKPPFRFTSTNSLSASSSRLFSSPSNLRKYYHERKKNKASLEDQSLSEVEEDLELASEQFEDHRRPMLHTSSSFAESSHGSSSNRFSSRFGKQINRSFGSVIQDTASSFLRRSSSPRFTSQTPKTILKGVNGRPQKYSLSNLGCASISDVLPTDSSSGYNNKRRVSFGRKLQYGEGSSQEVPREVITKTRNHSSRDTVISIRSRRGSSGTQNGRIESSRGEDSMHQLADSQERAPLSIPEIVQERSQRSLLTDIPSVFQDSSSSTGRTGLGFRGSRNRLISGSEDRDDYRRFNMEGIAEVLLALERIEQDEELTDEQLFVLEANLFFENLNLYDQHREMRLDIDNMSYEELLDLEEKIGTVSTALPEEALSKCIKRSTYRTSFTYSGISVHGDDVKCSICQDEYKIGAEVGRLPCDHRYHVECISQWLRLKNWCPICKVAAASSTKKAQS